MKNFILYPKILGVVCLMFILQKTYAQPKASFSSDITSGCAPLAIQFTDDSKGDNLQWKWDLGNGAISTQQNPSGVYLVPGTYTVKLIVKNNVGIDSVAKKDYITVYAEPKVDFTSSPTVGCPSLSVAFSDKTNPVSGTVAEWLWDFGDGKVSSEANPVHVYQTSGKYDVTLVAKNSFGCVQTTKKQAFITVNDSVKADFDYNYVNVCQPPSKVDFKNTSVSKNAVNYKWLFGDGEESTEIAPSHVYNDSGTYAIRLIVISDQGCSDTAVKNISIGRITPEFSFTNACLKDKVVFQNISSVKPSSVKWFFGDGTSATTSDAVHSFANTGNYEIKMIADFGSCKDSISKIITIVEKPAADFSVNIPPSCILPATVDFKNTSTGAGNYQWLFGDSTSSNENNPSHSYVNGGFYTVSLIAFNGAGCSDTVTKKDVIKIGPPKILKFENLPAIGCAPQKITPKAVIASAGPVAKYEWDFGDGTQSTDITPEHIYTQPGTYTVKLKVTSVRGCTDSFEMKRAVSIGEVPKANFSASPLDACAQTAIQFTDQSQGTITNWNWFFGDGGTSTAQNPLYQFTDTGYFKVRLIVANNACKDTLDIDSLVHLSPPVANFKPLLNCSSPYDRTFKDYSIGAKTWSWNFGDGTTSSEQSPSHTYTTPGTYFTTLTVTNGSCSYEASDSVRIIDEKPLFGTNSKDTVCRNDSVSFSAYNYNPGNISSFNWIFGDGTSTGFSSNSANVTHRYTQSGSFSAQLVTRDIIGCYDTVVNTLQKFRVYGPKASFSNPAGTCINSDVSFTDNSTTDGTHKIEKWIWTFGDSPNENVYNNGPFIHTYNTVGYFNVKLVVYDDYGCADSITKSRALEITNPVAQFTASDTVRCTKNTVSFKNLSAGSGLQYIWNFGDQLQETVTNPVHTYAEEGTYTISLNVKDKYGCTNSITKTNLVTISDPRASFTLKDSSSSCPPFLVEPVNTSQQSSAYTWDFGDGSSTYYTNPAHVYNTAGKFILRLIAKGFGQCADTAKTTITLRGPSGKLMYPPTQACNPSTVHFRASTKNIKSMIWDYNDGVTVKTTDSVTTHAYKTSGKFVPKLVLTDSAGCQVGIENKDTIVIADVKAGIHVEAPPSCDSTKVIFNDSSTVYNDIITSYSWKFGDGSTSTEANPFHHYFSSRAYNTALTVITQLGCTDSIKLPIEVTVYKSPKIEMDAPDSFCVLSATRFAGYQLTSDNITSWKWNFGDNQTEEGITTSHAFTKAGTYNISLIGTNEDGCFNTVTAPVVVMPVPNVSAGADTFLCAGESLKLQPRGNADFRWINDGTLSCSACTNPVARPGTSTTYYLNSVSRYGCASIDSVHVIVKQPVHVKITKADTLCLNEATTLKASGAEVYRWNPPLYLDNPNSPTPVFHASKDTAITYSLIGSDDKNCFFDTAKVKIKVYPIPQMEMDMGSDVVEVNVGSSVELKTKNSPDVTQWRWMPSKYLNDPTSSHPISTPKESITYACVAANGGSCYARAEITLKVICNGANVFIPNTFSPNQDGMNDIFYPRGKGLFNIRSMRIFNRWGQMVFEKLNFAPNDASAGWDGKMKGQALSPDVYVYMIETVCDNNSVIPIKGNVTLIR
ncbi:MAG: PKD domain-containing protein [Ilyomonas sp.]